MCVSMLWGLIMQGENLKLGTSNFFEVYPTMCKYWEPLLWLSFRRTQGCRTRFHKQFFFIFFEKEILTVWKRKFWQFGKGNFDTLEKEILTVLKEKFWQFEKGNFDSLKNENRLINTYISMTEWAFHNLWRLPHNPHKSHHQFIHFHQTISHSQRKKFKKTQGIKNQSSRNKFSSNSCLVKSQVKI